MQGPRRPRRRLGRTLSDGDHERRLGRDGYVVIPFLDRGELARVDDLLQRLGVAPGDSQVGLFNDSWSTDRSHKQAISDGLGAILAPAMRRWFVDHRALMLGTIVKWPGSEGAVPAHRDPNFVDERHHRSVGLWCALEPLDATNGTLEVLTGSHRDGAMVRAHQDPANLYPHLDHDPTLAPISLDAGDALVYDHRLVHRSPAHHREGPRVVVSGPVVPSGVDVRYTVIDPQGAPVQLEIDGDFFLDNKLDELDPGAAIERYRRAPGARRRRRPRGRERAEGQGAPPLTPP